MDIKCIGVIAKSKAEVAKKVVGDLFSWLRRKKVEVLFDEQTASLIEEEKGEPREILANKADVLIVLGGDGTLLSVARSIKGSKTPILAVNLGSMGFLTEVSLKELYPMLAKVLNGEYRLDPRIMLCSRLFRKGDEILRYHVLNDVVINKSALARIIDIEVTIDGHLVTVFKSDGLIISTPTGSTAYALAAGGPIIFPTMEAVIITPICPHSLTNRSLVVPPDSTIEAVLKTTDEEVYLTLDGQEGLFLNPEDRMEIVKSQHELYLIHSPRKNYFEVLRKKLKWGER
jgi:NAD+ kinase